MAHRRARLNVFGRQLLVMRIERQGWSAAQAADALGVTRTTAYKWLGRYRSEGLVGLEDRSSRPHRSPRSTPAEQVQAILRARVRRRYGPHRLAPLLGMPRSTIGDVLTRTGFSRLADADRPSGVPVRYVHGHPGSLVHQDHKKLGRIPPGGGHRFVGRVAGARNRAGASNGYDHFEVVVDDMSRVAYVAHVPDESAVTAAQALLDAAVFFAEHGVRIERVLTDNGRTYTTGPIYAAAIERIGARHKRTRPYRPQTNGKAERFIKTLLGEWAYGRLYRSNHERLLALPRWLDFYNHGRPHTALDGSMPMTALVNNVSGNHT
ncbi:MAG: IS481 family transposase [Candidatus Limnocylindrales bacterium]